MFNILYVLRCRDEFHSSGYKCLWGPFEMVVEYARNLSYMPQCKMAHSQNLSWGRKCGQYFYINIECGMNLKLLSSKVIFPVRVVVSVLLLL